jgi:hypothetical protein
MEDNQNIIPTVANPLKLKYDEDFEVLYANHIQYELNAFDFKLIFGQLDMGSEPGVEVVNQHTAMSIPWAVAKLMLYFLQVNVALHEAISGKVPLPPSITASIPEWPESPSGTENPNLLKIWDKLRAMRSEFLAKYA